MTQSRRPSRNTGLLLVILLAGASSVYGVMDAEKEFVLDFGKPEQVKMRATWNDPDKFDITDEGLGWDGPRNAHRDLAIQSTQLVGVGWSWRPVHAVHIRSQIKPPGEFKFREKSVTYPPGQLYARYSPDGKHWSSWNHLQMQEPENKDKPAQAYAGSLRVPYKEQATYRELIREYSRRNVPWASDEEAAVAWIFEDEPTFFKKNLPFIGYVQFLFEISLPGGQRIERIHMNLSYSAGGMHSPPKDEEVRKSHKGPWRFKAE